MRIDLPTCSFKLCRRYSDGNCTGSKGDRDECEEFKRSEQEPKQALDNGYGVYFWSGGEVRMVLKLQEGPNAHLAKDNPDILVEISCPWY